MVVFKKFISPSRLVSLQKCDLFGHGKRETNMELIATEAVRLILPKEMPVAKINCKWAENDDYNSNNVNDWNTIIGID